MRARYRFIGTIIAFQLALAKLASAQDPSPPAPERANVRSRYVETEELRKLAAEHASRLGPNGLPPGWIVVQEDIAVPEDSMAQQAPYQTSLWDSGVVPFEFDANMSSAQRSLAMDMMQLWEDAATLTFRPRTGGDVYYIHFRDSTDDEDPRSNSPVGPQLFGNTINFHFWDVPVSLAHEICHSLGCFHEQSRPDRNTYITVHFDRIEDDREFNFNIEGRAYGPYDYDSLMHYGQCAFSTCSDCESDLDECRTITTLDPDFQDAIGQRDHLSEWDKRIMSYLYPPSDWRFVDATYTGFFESGSFVEPWKTITRGLDECPTGGSLVIMRPGSYSARSMYSRAMTIHAPLGGFVLE